MEKCSNCGAAVRPGAKFCTSCGTRLNDTAAPAPNPASQPPSPTTIEATATTASASPASQPDQESTDDRYASWGKASSGWETSGSSTPADRFGAALEGPAESQDRPSSASSATNGSERSETYSASAWRALAQGEEMSDEDRFASWASAYGAYQAQTDEAPAGSSTGTDGDTGPEASEPAPTPSPSSSSSQNDVVIAQPVADSEARQRASALIEELRGLVWQIGLTEKEDGDASLAKIILAGARGQTGEFSDLTRVLDDLETDPRDIDALRALGAKSGRIRELMASHSRLLATIDEAIDELR